MIKTSTRPDRRRAAKAEAKREQYSGRQGLATYYAPSWVARSKYMPHIGSKERGRYAA